MFSLETLGKCPVCGSTSRHLEIRGARDLIFSSGLEKWNYWRCGECECLYLDPRPDRNTIIHAYSDYYTHSDESTSNDIFKKHGFFQTAGLKYALRNYHGGNTSSFWDIILYLNPRLKRKIDSHYRFAKRNQNEKYLLDVGCGNGGFLRVAESCGWVPIGVDPDPAAVAIARKEFENVSCGDFLGNSLDAQISQISFITMSHVIEHFHDPVAVLKKASNMLAPSGRLYLETPNANSWGIKHFGSYWRGLEPPRHLVIFSYSALKGLLNDCGFEIRSVCWKPEVTKNIFIESNHLKGKQTSFSFVDRLYRILSILARRKCEFITLVAEKL